MKKNNPFNRKMMDILDKYLPIKTDSNEFFENKFVKTHRKENLYSPIKTFSSSFSQKKTYNKPHNTTSENRINKKIKIYTELYKTDKYPINQDKLKINQHPYQSEKKLNDFMNTINFEEEKNDFKKINVDRTNENYKKNIKNFLEIFKRNNKPQKRYYVSDLNNVKGSYVKKSSNTDYNKLFMSSLEKQKLNEKDEFKTFLKFDK